VAQRKPLRERPCKYCDALIVDVVTEKSQRTGGSTTIPLDAKPKRRFVVIPDSTYGVVAQSVATYMPHHATCANVQAARDAVNAKGR
jgi:hypothetical protein